MKEIESKEICGTVLYPLDSVAKLLDVQLSTVRHLLRTKKLKRTVVAKKSFISEKNLKKYLEN